MKPLKTLTQAAALGGLALTAYAFWADEFGLAQTFVLTVFFFWAHVYAHAEIDM
jgi:hypothetical protein